MAKWLTSIKSFLIVSSLIELAAGAGLLLVPLQVVFLLTGASLEGLAVSTVARVAGAGLFALGVACWLGRKESQGRAAKALVAAMSFYNFAAASIFVWAGIGDGLNGAALWPAALLHSVMLIWCAYCLMGVTVLAEG